METINVSDEMREAFYQLFPRLRQTPHCFTSAENEAYNCIAWAMGDTLHWWDPGYEQWYYWPIESHDLSIESYLKAFSTQGYSECSTPQHEEGIEKIAIYMKDGCFKHVARQLPCGNWTSKCGQTFDISHTLEALEGDEYGSVMHIMQRPGSR